MFVLDRSFARGEYVINGEMPTMSERQHTYNVTVTWTGDKGEGTSNYRSYTRDHDIWTGEKVIIPGSSDPAFRGDATRWNPEELLVASLAACHKLWYLHLCATNDICVLAYEDCADGVMQENADGSGQFSSVTLKPVVTVRDGTDLALATRLHEEAHKMCFVARSVNFEVRHAPEFETQAA